MLASLVRVGKAIEVSQGEPVVCRTDSDLLIMYPERLVSVGSTRNVWMGVLLDCKPCLKIEPGAARGQRLMRFGGFNVQSLGDPFASVWAENFWTRVQG